MRAKVLGMPGAAIQTGSVDVVLPLAEIAPALVALVIGGAGTESAAQDS